MENERGPAITQHFGLNGNEHKGKYISMERLWAKCIRSTSKHCPFPLISFVVQSTGQELEGSIYQHSVTLNPRQAATHHALGSGSATSFSMLKRSLSKANRPVDQRR